MTALPVDTIRLLRLFDEFLYNMQCFTVLLLFVEERSSTRLNSVARAKFHHQTTMRDESTCLTSCDVTTGA